MMQQQQHNNNTPIAMPIITPIIAIRTPGESLLALVVVYANTRGGGCGGRLGGEDRGQGQHLCVTFDDGMPIS